MGDAGEGRYAFGSVGVCDEACRLNGSGYESTIGSLCGWHDHSPPPTKRGKNLTRWWFEFKSSFHCCLLYYHQAIQSTVVWFDQGAHRHSRRTLFPCESPLPSLGISSWKYPQSSHPHGTPIVDLERNPLILMRDRAYILKRLRRIRERKRPCLEPCLRFLLFAEEGANDRDLMYSEFSDGDDDADRGTKSLEVAASLLLRDYKNLAEPRSCQVSLGPNGMCQTSGIFLCWLRWSIGGLVSLFLEHPVAWFATSWEGSRTLLLWMKNLPSLFRTRSSRSRSNNSHRLHRRLATCDLQLWSRMLFVD